MAVSETMSEESAVENGAAVAMNRKGCGIVLFVLFIALVGVIKIPPLLVPREYTELLDAAGRGDIETIDRLLDAGLDVNAAYYEGLGQYLSKRGTWNTALIMAAQYGQSVAIEHLLDRGADPWIRNAAVERLAISYFATEVVGGMPSPCSLGPVATMSERKEIQRFELAKRAWARLVLRSLEESGGNKRRLAYIEQDVFLSGSVECLRKLASLGVDTASESRYIENAAWMGNYEIVAEYLHGATDPRVIYEAMTGAIRGGHTRIALLLLDAGANVNTLDAQRQTLLHIAVCQKDVNLVNELLKRGARTDITDVLGRRPIDIANDEALKQVLSQAQ